MNVVQHKYIHQAPELEVKPQQIVANEFWLPDSPLRKLLLLEMENQQHTLALRQNISKVYHSVKFLLKSDSCIKCQNDTEPIIEFFHLLHVEEYDHILHKLANAACLFPDTSMFTELSAYKYRQKERMQGELNDINDKLLQYYLNQKSDDGTHSFIFVCNSTFRSFNFCMSSSSDF